MRTLDLDRPPERLDAILETDEPGSPARIGSAHSVIADRKTKTLVFEMEIELDPRCVGVLRGVGEGF